MVQYFLVRQNFFKKDKNILRIKLFLEMAEGEQLCNEVSSHIQVYTQRMGCCIEILCSFYFAEGNVKSVALVVK